MPSFLAKLLLSPTRSHPTKFEKDHVLTPSDIAEEILAGRIEVDATERVQVESGATKTIPEIFWGRINTILSKTLLVVAAGPQPEIGQLMIEMNSAHATWRSAAMRL